MVGKMRQFEKESQRFTTFFFYRSKGLSPKLKFRFFKKKAKAGSLWFVVKTQTAAENAEVFGVKRVQRVREVGRTSSIRIKKNCHGLHLPCPALHLSSDISIYISRPPAGRSARRHCPS